LKDTLKHQGLRKQLILLLKQKGILNQSVLDAMNKVPRHLFLDSSFEAHAYQNKAFPIGADQTISHPFTVAFQTELMQLKANQTVLEIGTGCGYQTAVLLEMGVKVYSIERQQELFKKTKLFLPKLGYRAKQLIFGDGYRGLPEQAPFDSIIVTAGAPFVPNPLLSQLKIGGRLIIPIGDDPQIMHLYVRSSQTEFKKETFGEFRFVPMLENKN
jgi:protein-L-isoaspartate(D-aspartate) O-methyltransferase